MEAEIETVCDGPENVTLRLGRTDVRPRRQDKGEVEAVNGVSVRQGGTGRVSRPDADPSPSARGVPPAVPGDFDVVLGAVVAGDTLRGLEEGMAGLGGAAGILTLLEWVEVELEGFPELVEELRMLRGAVMAVAASVEGEW